MKNIKTVSPGVHSPTWHEQKQTPLNGDEARRPCSSIYCPINHLNITIEFWDAIHEISLTVFKKYDLIGRHLIKHHFIHHGHSWENLVFILCIFVSHAERRRLGLLLVDYCLPWLMLRHQQIHVGDLLSFSLCQSSVREGKEAERVTESFACGREQEQRQSSGDRFWQISSTLLQNIRNT